MPACARLQLDRSCATANARNSLCYTSPPALQTRPRYDPLYVENANGDNNNGTW